MKKIFVFCFLILFTIVLTDYAMAGSATVSWTANTEPDLASYRIYYGTTTRTGTDPKTCGLCGYTSTQNVTGATSYIFNNLTDGLTYYFSVTAIDTSGNISAFSTQVSKLITSGYASADVNRSGLVNAQDLSILMSYWGATNRPAADINQDGYVNAQDLSVMMGQWSH